ncbi:hypothetical protein [Spiroplasma endosymbiont of Aleiodes alternator]|uniref:hypothetical protein n=1 Tax=Spiroplasma endosymbiont of Aleiodes alternator TaxID=3139329 RepID=UPI003CCB2538
MPKEEKKPLLEKNKHTNYGITQQQSSINNSNSSSTESLNSSSTIIEIEDSEENNWITCNSRYGGTTQKKLDDNENWKYETQIRNNFDSLTFFNESTITINNNQYWQKLTFVEKNGTVIIVILELLKINFNRNTIEIYKKEYNDVNEYIHDNLDLKTFQKKERKLSLEDQFLEGITIKTINNLNKFITNTNSLNEQLKLFKENSNNRDLNVLLKLYKFLTIIQNFIDQTKPGIIRNIAYKFLGLLEIYIGLTGKNLQRVVSNFPIDGKEHTSQDYIDAIFWNWQNYVMVLLDTALGTFFTSAASSWSRNVFFNKKNKTNPIEINQFNTSDFEKYKEIFETLLFEEDHQKLMKYFSNISILNDLIQKFNQIENCVETEFEYHPNFKKEIERIKKLIINSQTENNNANNDIEIKQVISLANKTIKTMEQQNNKPIALVTNWGRNLLVNLTLETLTWAGSHIILTGSSENTSKEDFNLHDWITKDIFTTGALAANISRYFVMRPINNIFKSGLTNLGIPTNLCPEKLSKWVEKQTRYKKILMAIPLFLSVTCTVNAVKTEAALVTEYGFQKATKLFYEKFVRWTTLGFSIGVTAIDMIAFAISDFYKDVFNQPITIKKITEILTSCCGFTKKEAVFLEKNLEKLENNGKFTTFDELFKKYQEEEFEDSGIEEVLSQQIESEKSSNEKETDDETSIEEFPIDNPYEFANDINNQPSTNTGIYHPMPFN